MSSGREPDSWDESPEVLCDVMVSTETRQLKVNRSIAASVGGHDVTVLQVQQYSLIQI